MNLTNVAQQERLRNKIIARLTKEGSSAEEPTNIVLTDYSSDEGNISQSFSSEEERTEYTDAAWASEGGEFLASRRRYLCVPPPSPTFVPPRSVGLYRRRARRDVAGRIYLERRRNLARRAVMDLPTTDPGSDLCDMTDSADESFVRSEGREYDGEVWRSKQEYREKIIELSEKKRVEKEEQQETTLILPEIITRPRSVSFGELLPRKDHRKARQRPRCLRTLRNSSPVSPTSREMRLKLTSLRRQIWTGVSTTATTTDAEGNNAERLVDAFVKTPLSWGISRHALTHYPTDGEVTLKSQSKKAQSPVYDADKDDARKTRKKSRRNATQMKVVVRTDGQKPSSRRKSTRLDWQRAVTLNSRGKDVRIARTSSLLTIEADSLKLLAASTTASKQPQRPQRKLESRRKFRGVGAVASTCVGVGAKASAAKPTRTRACRRDAFCESTTSDDSSSDSGKLKVVKKKQKKKKQQQPPRKPNRGTEQGKRVCSAKTSRNNV